MDAQFAMETSVQWAADARHLLSYYPDHILRIVNRASGAVLWAIDAWLLARNVEERGGSGAIRNRYRDLAGDAAGSAADRLLSRLFWLEYDRMHDETPNKPIDPARWRSEMNDALREIAEFVAAIAAEIGVPIDEDEAP